jgi:hypothetical protein
MNWKKLLNWLKINIGLTVGGVIALGVIGWIYMGTWESFSRQSGVAADLENATSQLDRLRNRKPYPHVENVATLSNNVARLASRDDALGVAGWLDKLAAASPAPPDVPRAEFNPLLVRRKGVLLATARKNGVALPDNFGFGFGRYVNAGLAPANDANEIRLLLTQWNTIETITQALFSNKVERIDAIRRATFDIPREATGGGQPTGPAGEESVAATIRDKPTEVSRTLPFEIEFTCDTDSLRGILNALAAAPQFFIVRSVALANNRLNEITQGGRPDELKGEQESAAAPPGPGAPAPPAAPAPVPAPTPGVPGAEAAPAKSNEPVLVFGLEKLNVKLRVDLIEFRQPDKKPSS